MRHLFQSAAVLALAIATSATVATTASAQAASPTAAKGAVTADNGTTAVEELVVTAERRSESLRDVPATISAVTADQLQAIGPVASTGDLLRTMPGVRFNDLESTNLSEVSIRGSGTQRATGADSGVGLFVNGAYVGSSTLGGRNFRRVDFFDQERVEVLEGPQGALYGRNSEYGVVNVVLAKPKFDDSGYVDATYTDELRQMRIAAVANHQVNDDVAIRVGAEHVGQSKGFFFNPDTSKYYDHTDGWIGRGELRYKHGPLDVTVLLDGQNLNLPTFLNSYVLPPGVNAQVPKGLTQDRFVVGHDISEGVHQDVQRAMVLADYDLGWAQLSSTTMATHWVSEQSYSGSGIDMATEVGLQASGQIGIYPFARTSTVAKDRTLYQDLHLTGDLLNHNLEYLAGADYLLQHDLNGVNSYTSPCPLTLGASICTGTVQTPVCLPLLPTSRACPTPFPLAFGTWSTAPLRNQSWSVYGLMRYHLGPFTLAGELRYSQDDKQASNSSVLAYTTTPAAPSAAYAFSSDRLNYTLNVSYKIPGPMQALVYAKVGTGYRAGGVNARVSSPAAPNPFRPTYDNEDTTSYEAGFKGNLLSNIYFRLSAYESRTANAITSINDGCTVLNACGKAATVFNINGGTVHADGVEAAIDGRFHVADGALNISLNGGHQHAKFVSTPGGYSGLPIVGSSVAQIPDWTASAVANYRHAITGSVDGFLNVAYQEQKGGVQDTVTAATPAIDLKDIDLWNLRAGIDFKKLEVAVFVQNLFDRQIALLQFTANNAPLANRYSTPRAIGLNVNYRW
jgi:iron complex outermembrane receptor protein